jgi:hypothetical protein
MVKGRFKVELLDEMGMAIDPMIRNSKKETIKIKIKRKLNFFYKKKSIF